MTLAEKIRDLLCPIRGRGFLHEERVLGPCNCDYPMVVRLGCAYGRCELYYCQRCRRLIKFRRELCYFPYNPP